ncbi:MAG: HAMP domain-containing protein [Sphingobacteriales bacterium]|nr:HAMP domain-containing protein [Sphingobacteriales bacterium]
MAVLIYSLSKENIHRNFRQQIRSRAGRAAYLYNLFQNDTTNLLKSLDANAPPALFNKNIGIYNASYKELYEFHDLNVQELKPDTSWLYRAKENGEYFLKIGEKDIGIFSHENSVFVVVGAENISGKAYLNNLEKIFIIYFPLAVLVTLAAGFLFSNTIIRPIKRTIHDVKLITSQNLSHRLFTGKRKDELAELNQTFNALLNRLEESFAMEKRFITNASHELSTPLTSISSQIEVALLQGRTSEEYRKVLSSVLKDAEGLHQLTRNLLEIAKAGTHGIILLEKLRIDEILIKAHGDVLRQNNLYKVELSFPDLPEDENECMVFGNTHLLHSAIKNIMENGCKYSPDNKIKVELHFKGTEVEMLFNNKSEFLPSEEIEKLFEPFYRSNNAKDQPGVGLGLTLTRRIIGLHKGTLTIHSDLVAGTHIRIQLPTLKR